MADELGIVAERVERVVGVEGVDLLFLGCGKCAWRPPRAVRRFLFGITTRAGVRVALFRTDGGDPLQLDWMARLVQEKGGEVIGRFSFMGRQWFTLGLIGWGHPDAVELEAAASFARQTCDRSINAAQATGP